MSKKQAEIEFTLPFGCEVNGVFLRNGRMRTATMQDEMDAQNADGVGMNARYRDIALLSQVVTLNGAAVTIEMMRNLYEPDFIYLQLLYRWLNGACSKYEAACPRCKASFAVDFASIYADMSVYERTDK